MHFTFDVNIGQVVTVLTILGMGWKINRVVTKLLYEHEILMLDWAERTGTDLDKLPTRVRRG